MGILEQKERRGSSLVAIIKFINHKFSVVPTEATSGLVRRTIKNLQKEGRIIPGAVAGRKGSGCFKLGPEEKTRIDKDAKFKAKMTAINQVNKAPVEKAARARAGSLAHVKKVKKAMEAGDGKVVSGEKVSPTKLAAGKEVKSAAHKKLIAGKEVESATPKKPAAGKEVKTANCQIV